MSDHKRLSICYAAPGHYLLSSAGPTRNVLNVAKALSQWAAVTVAFRRVVEPINTDKYRVIAIEPEGKYRPHHKDDYGTRGLNPLPHIAYFRTLRAFARQQAGAYDLILEKGWRLSGLLSATFRCQGVPGILIENDVHYWSESLQDMRTVSKYLLHQMGQGLAGFYSRRVPIIAETEELKAMLVSQRSISPERIEVVGLGVDHAVFRPLDQSTARQALGMHPRATVLLYVGGMDQYHDLGPVLEAFAMVKLPTVELHLVGDGELRTRYEEQAKHTQSTVHLHGPVPHAMVPRYIAAADLCLAPYRTSAFHNGLIPFSTLKIPEYMACARPVISVASGHVQRLVADQVSGFLFPNEISAWVAFLHMLPCRQRLDAMGRAAAQAVAALTWEKTAAQYLEVCHRLVA